MTLDQLWHFVTAAKLQNLTRAGDELYLSHSTISRSIASLEQELGTQLLIRSSRSVSCTKAGELLKMRASKLLEEVDSIRRDVSALDSSDDVVLRIACGFPLGKEFLDFTEKFRDSHPEIGQTFYSVTPFQSFEDLRNGRCDIAVSFSYAQPNQIKEMRWVTIDKGSHRLLTSIHNPLASRTSIGFEEAEWVAERIPSHADEEVLDAAEDEYKWGEARGFERNLETVFLPVQLNQASIVVPEHVCRSAGELCIGIPITGRDTSYDVNACYISSNPNPGISAFMSMLKENFAPSREFDSPRQW